MHDYKLELDFPDKDLVTFTSEYGTFFTGPTPRYNEFNLTWNNLTTTLHYDDYTKLDENNGKLLDLLAHCCKNWFEEGQKEIISGLGVLTKLIGHQSLSEKKCNLYVEKLVMYDLRPLNVNFGELDYSSNPSVDIIVTWMFTKADYELKILQQSSVQVCSICPPPLHLPKQQ